MSTPLSQSSTRQLSDLLLAFASAVQQLRVLPEGHPAVAKGIAGLGRALDRVLYDRPELVVDVGNVQLLVEGMETNPDFEPTRDLAMLLRDIGAGSLIFRSGIGPDELAGVLKAIANYSDGGAALPGGPHLKLRPHRPSGPHSADPWRALERLALDDPNRDRASLDMSELAVGLELHPGGPGSDGRVLELLAQIALSGEHQPADAALLNGLVQEVPFTTLRQLLAPGVHEATAQEFLLSCAVVLPPPTLLRLAQAVAPGRDRLFSPGALRVLARMVDGVPADGPAARALGEEFRRLVLLAYGQQVVASRMAPEPDRILKLTLESGILEPGTLLAAERMIARRQIAPLLALLDTVPREDPVARAVRTRLFHPLTVRILLDASPVDLEALDGLIPGAGIEAAPALIDALAESRERRVRLRLLDLLARYGDAVGPLALARMDGMPWYVQRNLLVLLRRLPDRPKQFSPEKLLHHRDARVRHEAVALALEDPGFAGVGIAESLESSYQPTLRLGLTALGDNCPPERLPRVVALAVDPSLDPDLRALAVTALGRVKDPTVLRLLRRLVVGRGLASLSRLAPRSPPMLAALRALARHWDADPKVVPLLEAARQARDPAIREAASSMPRRSDPALPGS